MSILNSQIVLLAMGLLSGSGAAQAMGPVTAPEGVSVRLEPHLGKTHFQIGDPIIVDLVFTSRSEGYMVETDENEALPPRDQVDLAPSTGWVRTHSRAVEQSCCNETSTLDEKPVRVPVLLNRTITFLTPGHYIVTVATGRLRTSRKLDVANPVETNAVEIDLSLRSGTSERALVETLSDQLEKLKGEPPRSQLPPEIKSQLDRDIAAGPDGSSQSAETQRKLTEKIAEFEAKETAADKRWSAARRETAVRLACLDGDEAVRAKVRFISEETEAGAGEAKTIVWTMVDGLSSSRNKQLQLALVEAAWQNPTLLPTYPLLEALRQARELTQKNSVTDSSIMWAPAEHQATLVEYQREINELIATLPSRSESNRAETIKFLKSLGFPNPFNRSGNPADGTK